MSNFKKLSQDSSLSSLSSIPSLPNKLNHQSVISPLLKEDSEIGKSTTSIVMGSQENQKRLKVLHKSTSIQLGSPQTPVGFRKRADSGVSLKRRVAGSIIIETPSDQLNSKSIDFSEDLYNKIEGYLDEEGLDIVEAETFRSGFMQVLKIMVVENSENDPEGMTNFGLQRKLSSPVPQLNTISSKLFLKRRASTNEQTFSSLTVSPSKPTSTDDSVIGSNLNKATNEGESEDGKKKYFGVKSNKGKLATLVSVESRQELGSEVFDYNPSITIDSSPRGFLKSKNIVESLESIVFDGLKKPLIKFIPVEQTPGRRRVTLFATMSEEKDSSPKHLPPCTSLKKL